MQVLCLRCRVGEWACGQPCFYIWGNGHGAVPGIHCWELHVALLVTGMGRPTLPAVALHAQCWTLMTRLCGVGDAGGGGHV